MSHSCALHLTTVVPVHIDIERRVIDVIENQEFVEVCLVKSGQSLRPIMAIVNANEIMDNVGSPGEPSIITYVRKIK